MRPSSSSATSFTKASLKAQYRRSAVCAERIAGSKPLGKIVSVPRVSRLSRPLVALHSPRHVGEHTITRTDRSRALPSGRSPGSQACFSINTPRHRNAALDAVNFDGPRITGESNGSEAISDTLIGLILSPPGPKPKGKMRAWRKSRCEAESRWPTISQESPAVAARHFSDKNEHLVEYVCPACLVTCPRSITVLL